MDCMKLAIFVQRIAVSQKRYKIEIPCSVVQRKHLDTVVTKMLTTLLSSE